MNNFKDLQTELLEKAKLKRACQDQYKRAASSMNESELLKVIHDNIEWCLGTEIITNEYLLKFNPEILLQSGLANTGKDNTGISNSGYRNSGYRNSGNWNSGKCNSGYRNSGNRNSGDCNSGYRNSGYWNSGDCNSGYWNSGYRNSGDCNSGYRNSGNCNSGDCNSGDCNSGYRNSGNWNSGDCNSGDCNSGYRNSGAFCTDNNPKAFLFNKESSLTVKEWENHPAYNLMYEIVPTIWIPSNMMSAEEKETHPNWETTEGYLKNIPMKEAWLNFWGNLSDANKNHFLTLPNFDAEIFEEITGINTKK